MLISSLRKTQLITNIFLDINKNTFQSVCVSVHFWGCPDPDLRNAYKIYQNNIIFFRLLFFSGNLKFLFKIKLRGKYFRFLFNFRNRTKCCGSGSGTISFPWIHESYVGFILQYDAIRSEQFQNQNLARAYTTRTTHEPLLLYRVTSYTWPSVSGTL